VPDFLEQKQSELAGRMDELRPLVDEYARLEAAAAALDSVNVSAVAVSRANAALAAPQCRNGRYGERETAKGTPAKRNQQKEKRRANMLDAGKEVARVPRKRSRSSNSSRVSQFPSWR